MSPHHKKKRKKRFCWEDCHLTIRTIKMKVCLVHCVTSPREKQKFATANRRQNTFGLQLLYRPLFDTDLHILISLFGAVLSSDQNREDRVKVLWLGR